MSLGNMTGLKESNVVITLYKVMKREIVKPCLGAVLNK